MNNIGNQPTPYVQPPYGQVPYGQSPYLQDPSYGQAPFYGQPPYDKNYINPSSQMISNNLYDNEKLSGNYGSSIFEFNPEYKRKYENSDEYRRSIMIQQFYKELSDKLTSKNIGFDPLKLTELLSKPKLDDRDLNKFYRHLLNYTYASTVTEIKNHEAVNQQLAYIRTLLLSLLPENKDRNGIRTGIQPRTN